MIPPHLKHCRACFLNKDALLNNSGQHSKSGHQHGYNTTINSWAHSNGCNWPRNISFSFLLQDPIWKYLHIQLSNFSLKKSCLSMFFLSLAVLKSRDLCFYILSLNLGLSAISSWPNPHQTFLTGSQGRDVMLFLVHRNRRHSTPTYPSLGILVTITWLYWCLSFL